VTGQGAEVEGQGAAGWVQEDCGVAASCMGLSEVTC
jgi:hypothetical protein